MEEKRPNELKIEIDEATAQGAYANLALITHTEQEFVLDFMFVQPQNPQAKVRSRVITSPGHAKRLAAALTENIAKYEQRFGAIKEQKPPEPGAPAGVYH